MTGRRFLVRWAIASPAVLFFAFAFAFSQGWVPEPRFTKGDREPTVKSDYVGTIEVSADDAKLYRAVPFEWRIYGPGGHFKGSDTAHVRVDSSGERTLICGWLKLDGTGTSVRASRWLSQARLKVGDLVIAATFISIGDGKEAGCAGLFDDLKPAAAAALTLDGPAVPE